MPFCLVVCSGNRFAHWVGGMWTDYFFVGYCCLFIIAWTTSRALVVRHFSSLKDLPSFLNTLHIQPPTTLINFFEVQVASVWTDMRPLVQYQRIFGIFNLQENSEHRCFANMNTRHHFFFYVDFSFIRFSGFNLYIAPIKSDVNQCFPPPIVAEQKRCEAVSLNTFNRKVDSMFIFFAEKDLKCLKLHPKSVK